MTQALNHSFALFTVKTVCAALATLALCISAQAQQQNKLDLALDTQPQANSKVDYDNPSKAERSKCRIEPTRSKDSAGWIVYDQNGRIIRKLIDTNGDKRLDQRSFYKDGIEVYRDIDSNYDKKFDQHRWLGTAGTKWAVDKNGDGEVDSWRIISAEEVSFEVVEAIKQRSPARFVSLMITDREIDALGLGPNQLKEVKSRVAKARKEFVSFARSQRLIGKDSDWIHFGGMRPGIIPAGTYGSTSDVMIYDSVAAVIENGGRSHGQLSIGTLIKVGNAWRVVDLPEPIIEGKAVANGALFFRNIPSSNEVSPATPVGAGNQELFAEYDKLDKQMANARPSEVQKLNAKRADLFVRFVNSSENQDQSNWVRQMADMVSAAYQQGQFDDGATFLRDTIKDFEKAGEIKKDDINYCKYRFINSFYSRKISEATQKEVTEIQDEYMEKLAQFVKLNPKHENSADAMLQLALDDEANGEINEAKDWYARIVRDFPNSALVNRARGAATRLNSEGRSISLKGRTLDNKQFDLRDRVGKIVLIQYWGTWSETCKSDMKQIKEAYNDYSSRGFDVVSVSLDYELNELKNYLRENPLPWTQLFAEGNLDSPLAEQLGVAMVPTMILVGADGKVIDRNVVASDIDRLLSRQFSRSAKRDRKK